MGDVVKRDKSGSAEQAARLARRLFAAENGAEALQESEARATAIRENIARLRELRLAKGAQETRPREATVAKRSQRGACEADVYTSRSQVHQRRASLFAFRKIAGSSHILESLPKQRSPVGKPPVTKEEREATLEKQRWDAEEALIERKKEEEAFYVYFERLKAERLAREATKT